MWRIDRLTHKKLADIGSRTILSAWFDNKGAKLVMIEQCTVDEFRVVVCSPQTMEIKLEDNIMSIVPYHPTVSSSQRTLTMIVGVVALHYHGVDNRLPQLS